MFFFCKITSSAFPKIPICPYRFEEICLKTKIVSLIFILLLSSNKHIYFQIFLYNLLLQFLLRHSCLKTASSTLDVINCIQYPYCFQINTPKLYLCVQTFPVQHSAAVFRTYAKKFEAGYS